MAFAVRATSQGTGCSQPCIPRATKDFLFKLSENSPRCPFTQEQSEPPVAIVVKVFCNHRGPASSKEPQSPHSGIVSLLTQSSHRTHITDFYSGPFILRNMGPIPSQVCSQWLYLRNELLAWALILYCWESAFQLLSLKQVIHTSLDVNFLLIDFVCLLLHTVDLREGAQSVT